MRVIADRAASWLGIVSLLGVATQSWAFTFSPPVAVDNARQASEPGVVVDSQDRIYIHAPNGLIGPSRLWRSTDGGSNFTYIAPENVGIAVPPNVTIGGGDADLAIDKDNNLYFIDLWLGNFSAAVSKDQGDHWAGLPWGSVPVQDRPWVSADPTKTGTVFTVTDQIPTGLFLSTSLPGLAGLTYPLSVLEISNTQRGFIGFTPPGNLVTNRKGDTYNVYSIFTGSGGGGGIGLGKLPAGSLLPTTSQVTPANGAGDQTQAFPIVAVDNGTDDNLYVVWTDPVSDTDWQVRFASFNGVNWSNAVTLGHGLYPWVTAQAPGKVDVAWYGASNYSGNPNLAPSGTSWNVKFAQSVSALAATPTFTVQTAVSGVKTGAICTAGVNCSADRELGDFLSIAHDSSGHALISYNLVPTPGQSLVRFVKQTDSATIQ